MNKPSRIQLMAAAVASISSQDPLAIAAAAAAIHPCPMPDFSALPFIPAAPVKGPGYERHEFPPGIRFKSLYRVVSVVRRRHVESVAIDKRGHCKLFISPEAWKIAEPIVDWLAAEKKGPK